MTASSYLSYGGILKVVRTNSDNIVNATSRRQIVEEITEFSLSFGADTGLNTGTYIVGEVASGLATDVTGYGYTTTSAGEGATFQIGIGTTGELLLSLIHISEPTRPY